jgi:hypothetical protein
MYRIDDEISNAKSAFDKQVGNVAKPVYADVYKWVDFGYIDPWSGAYVSNWQLVKDTKTAQANYNSAKAHYDKKVKGLTDNYSTTNADLVGKKNNIESNVSTAKTSLSDLFQNNQSTIFDPYQQNYISGYIGQLDNFKKAAERKAMFSNYRQGVASGSVSQSVNPTVERIYSDEKTKYINQGDSVFNAIREDYNKAREDYLNPERYGSNFDQLPALNPTFAPTELSNAAKSINSLRVRAADILPNIAGMQNPYSGVQIGAQMPTVSAQTAAASPTTGVNIQNPYQPIIPQTNKIFPSFTGASSSNQSSSSSFVR